MKKAKECQQRNESDERPMSDALKIANAAIFLCPAFLCPTEADRFSLVLGFDPFELRDPGRIVAFVDVPHGVRFHFKGRR